MSESTKLRFRTFGVFRVTAPDGADLTPRSRKACGLLALLLDAPDFARPRALLQDKLWSDRAPLQGAASLRQALTEIRVAFRDHRDVLHGDRWTVTLDHERVEADFRDPVARARARQQGELFLGDVDVRDGEFENWLRDRRQAFEDAPEPDLTKRFPEDLSSFAPPNLVLAIRATEPGSRIGRSVVQAVARGVADRGSIAMRWEESHGASRAGETLTYRLEADERLVANGTSVSLQLTSLDSGLVRWQIDGPVPKGVSDEAEVEFARLVSEGVDRTVHTLSMAYGGGRPGADPTLFFRLIEAVFTKRGLDYDEASRGFRLCFEQERRGVYLAWQALMSCYMLGERRPCDVDALKSQTRELLCEAIKLEPHNALVLALSSYTQGFVLKNVTVAHELAVRGLRLDRGSVLGWLSMGVASNYLGQFDEGYACLTKARAIAGEGPYRHMVDLHAGISAALTGRFAQAISILETVHTLTPDFAPPLRYLLATYFKIGETDRAEDTIRRLRRLEPDFVMPDLRDPGYPVPALQRSEMLDLKRLPTLI